MGDILKGLDMDVSLVPVKKIGCPCTVFGPSSKQPPRIVEGKGAFFKDISYFGKNRISKNFGYRGASGQFFFALGEIFANKKTLRKKSKICIFELKFSLFGLVRQTLKNALGLCRVCEKRCAPSAPAT